MNYHKYPIRNCKSLHHCQICRKKITVGEDYYDGGYDRRAHKTCIDKDVGERKDGG